MARAAFSASFNAIMTEILISLVEIMLMLTLLAANGVNIDMISTSEIKISVIIALKDADKAARAIHDAFELGK